MIAAADEFAVRFYRWALADARREVEQGLPLLRTVKWSLAIRAVAWLESLAGDAWSADEERVERDYLAVARVERPEEAWYRQVLLHDPGRLRVARGRLLERVKAEVTPSLGAGSPFGSKTAWLFETPLGPWRLATFIDVGGHAPLAYTQTIRVDPARVLMRGVCVTGWLGIAGGQTVWQQITEADAPAAVQSLTRACEHFLRAAPALVDGLGS